MQNKHQTFFFGGPTYGEGGGPLVWANAKLFPKMHFEGPPYCETQTGQYTTAALR